MFLIYCGLVALLSCCGLRYVDCQPSFTVIPNNGNPIYVTEGAGPLTLAWDYNADGRTVDKVFLVYMNGVHEVVVAGKAPSGSLQIQSGVGYDGRVTFRGRATFEISSIVPSDSRIFKCRVTFETFQPPEISRSNVEVVVVVPPTITLKSPTSVELDEGSSTTLLCFATGNPKPTYKWEKGSIIVQENADSNYTIASANKDHTGRYTCTATVTAPGVQHPVGYFVDVKVRYKPQVSSLTGNRTLDDGSNAEFFCKAVAYPTAITYNWFKDGSAITHDPSRKIFVNIVGSQSRLRVEQIKKDSAGRYSCSGTNALGTGEQEAVFLKVNYAPQNVTVKPERAEVKEGQSTTLTCHSDGYPTPGFSWKFNGNVLNGATQNTFMLTNVEVKDAGNYTCVANNDRGSKETTRVVNVLYKPTITTLTTGTPNNNVVQGTTVVISCSANGYPVPSYTIKRNGTDVTQNAGAGKHRITDIQLSAEYDSYSCVPRNSEGDGPRKVLKITVQVPPRFFAQTLPTTRQVEKENTSVSYSCVAKAKPAAKIQWVLNGKNLTNSPPYNISGSFQTIQGSKLFKTFSYLDIAKLTWRQYGNFSCVAYNEAGQLRQNTELEVRYRPVVQFPADHPKNLTLGEGATAKFSCKTIGNPPTTAQKWQFNGVDIPGESCSGCTTIIFQKGAVSQSDAGWYSCIGTNSLGDGPPASAQLLIKHAPKITYFPQDPYTVNETNSVSMVCRAGGVPRPTITWVKELAGNDEKFVGEGEQFTIANTSGSDDGKYTCRARNELGSDSREVTLNVQTRPTITTSNPMAINVPGAKDEEVVLTCRVSAKPQAQLSWKRNLDGNELSTINDDKVKSILKESGSSVSIIMTVVVTTVNEEFYCVAVNLLGSNFQKYRIRERGAPDAPEDVRLVPFQVPGAKTVSVNVSWTPGYNGGFPQGFSILYRKKESGGDFTEESVGNPPNNMHTVQNLSPETEYEFKLHATNERGKGEASPLAQVTTKDSAVAPDRGTVTATRSSDDPTVVIVTWTVLDKGVTKLSIEMQEGESSKAKRAVAGWQPVPGASDLDTSKTEFKVENLKPDKVYRFRVGMIKAGEDLSTCGQACYVESEPVRPGPIPGERGDDGALQDWMIAVIAGVAGLLLLGIVILCLCCFMRRKKSLGDNQVNMSQTSSYVVGGPEVNRSLDTRPRSYGMESVEDDPFIEAHFASMQSMNTSEGKKKKPDNGVNYGYLSQDSVQNQPEMLLNPGSRLPRNHPVAQSTGDLDANSGYPARGPQRDFSTLPPYHEPPSFEEAMRQSGRKPKTRKSTGDLTGPGQARHSGRRPRQSPADEPTDSSDGEFRYTPQRAAPPPPRVRHVESSREDPRYAAVDLGHGLGPRVLPQGPLVTSAPRNNGPLDPTVPYAMPQKKKSRKPRSEPGEPAFGPPPQYTPEDRAPEEPVQLPGDLDLDDPSTLPASERPPDLPPPMAMLPSSRSMPVYYDDPDDGLPEPPAFLRDVVRPPDGREPRYEPDRAAPYHPPPSPGRQRQPYVNIHGQLVRPSSRDSDDFRRPESLRSSRDALTPEPETPSHQWQPRGNEPDNRGAPEINYVSYLV